MTHVLVVAIVCAPAALRAPVVQASIAGHAPRPSVRWVDCAVEGPRCGRIDVPLDRTARVPGTISIGFERWARRESESGSLGTIIAVEGGPGYATTASRDLYVDLFEPLMDRRDLILVDLRGTGTSEPVRCPRLQGYEGEYERAVEECGESLGERAPLYSTAPAADDLAEVLDALGIERVDLYGDSYGTFFAQAFAVRHADRLRTVVLDSAYPVEGQDPWYRDLNRALRDAFRIVCARDQRCDGDPVERIRALVERLRLLPFTGTAHDADGMTKTVTLDPGAVAYLAASAAYGVPIYRDLDAAIRAFMRTDGADALPLLRLAAENLPAEGEGAGAVREYSEGLYVEVMCTDYPQVYDLWDPIAERERQYAAGVAALRSGAGETFAPFSVDDWVGSPWAEYRSCLRWPVSRLAVAPVPELHEYPDLPVLVLNGDLDSLTSPEGARRVAERFPRSTYVELANGTHVAALGDRGGCASAIVLRFVAEREVGDTSCAAEQPRVRVVEEFSMHASDLRAASPGSRVPGTEADRRVVAAVGLTIADVIPRWLTASGTSGVGLRGGTFDSENDDYVEFDLKGLRFVQDVSVSGRMTWDRRTRVVHAKVTIGGAGTDPGELVVHWDDWTGNALVTGEIGGRPIDLVMPAP